MIIPAISTIVTSVAVTFVSICSGTVMLLVGLEEVFFLLDFYVGFIGSKDFSCIVIVVVYEWFDADSNCLTEVSYLLVGYVNVVKFF